MKKIIPILVLTTLFACKKDKVVPVSERIQKVWSAQVVKESGTVVYTKGSNSNSKPGYNNFRLDLSVATVAKLTEFEGTTFSGQWEVSADEKTLTLKNLTPQPTDTNGSIQYTIGTLTDNSLTLSRSTASSKTGGSLNEYQLVSL
jgi:hypothetical protein